MNELGIMREVLKNESEAIGNLVGSLDESHEKMIKVCSECSGKLIFTGMGKSGHVARKISATMASLGNPSFFLHPGEAAHGDLGMVEKKDIVIMISKSGETEELIHLVNSLKIIGCKMLGVFCRSGSSLECCCDYSVVLPVEKEACMNNLAPTTSTTLTMAFGDALAITLSHMKQFDKQSFALFHPRGTLGKQLLLDVATLANKNMGDIAVGESDEVRTILWMITKNRLGAVTVVSEEGKLVGLVTDGDIRRAIEKNESILSMQAKEIMTLHPTIVQSTMLAVDAFTVMRERKISVLPICNADGGLVGVVSFHDIVESGIIGGK